MLLIILTNCSPTIDNGGAEMASIAIGLAGAHITILDQ
jgi:hypothetical protein